jgi:hypothetical protein
VIDLSSAEDMLKFLEGGTATQDFCVDCLRTCFHTVTFTDPTHSELINIYAARKDSIAQPSRRSFPWTADVSRKGGIILRDVFDSSRLDVLRTNSTPDFIRTKLCGLLVLYLAQQSKPHMDHSKWVRWFDIAGDEWRPTIAQLAVQCEDLNEEEAFRLAGVRLREASFAGRMHESTILVETLFRMRGHIAFGGSRVTDLVEARSEA